MIRHDASESPRSVCHVIVGRQQRCSRVASAGFPFEASSGRAAAHTATAISFTKGSARAQGHIARVADSITRSRLYLS